MRKQGGVEDIKKLSLMITETGLYVVERNKLF